VAPWLDALVAALVVAAAVAAVVWLRGAAPDGRGYDTHVQLGLAPCSWPVTHGGPCPLCGCTTAACHLVHGEPLRALWVQPFGALVAMAGLLLGGAAGWCLLRGRSFVDFWLRLPRARLFVLGIVLLLLAWCYKGYTFAR
jgi:hypothetical protein